jgi:hypothetical protein
MKRAQDELFEINSKLTALRQQLRGMQGKFVGLADWSAKNKSAQTAQVFKEISGAFDEYAAGFEHAAMSLQRLAQFNVNTFGAGAPGLLSGGPTEKRQWYRAIAAPLNDATHTMAEMLPAWQKIIDLA